jgi:DNA primase
MKFDTKTKPLSKRKYAQKDIDAVLKNVRHHEVIGQFVSLRRAGSDWVGRCPFHHNFRGSSKSFRVCDRRKVWKCFACGTGGHSLTKFICDYHLLENVSFCEALEYINRVHVKTKLVPIGTPKKYEKYMASLDQPYDDGELPF